MKRLTELVNLEKCLRNPEENNPTATEPGTTAPGNTNQDTQVKPNTDQTATGTPAGTDNQNTQQGNTEQNNQNAQPSAPGTTDQAGATVKPSTTPIKTLKLNLIQIKIIHQLMVKTGIKQVKVLK